MKKRIILAILLIFICGCSIEESVEPGIIQDNPASVQATSKISGTKDLMLTGQDLEQIGMTSDELGCQTDEGYTNIVDSSEGQYTFCRYNLLDDTEIVVELQKFADHEALNGSYQYNSLHLYSVEGLISENDYGDQSRFRVNDEHDYGGQYNDPDIYYYHLWICKDLYLIHITSKGSKEAEEYVAETGHKILSKFG